MNALTGLFKTAVGGLSGLWWLPWAIAGVSLLTGAGGTLWYRSQYHACIAAQAEALATQRDIDRADNARAVGQLTGKLQANEASLDKALRALATIKSTGACESDPRIRAARDILCSKYPTSEACLRREPSSKVP